MRLPKGAIHAMAGISLLALTPRAEAAYFNLADWQAAVSALPPVAYTEWPATSEEFSDTYGDWTRATAGTPVYVGPGANPYNPSGYTTRQTTPLPPPPVEGVMAGIFSCHSFYRGCLGVKAITYKLPYQVIGLYGDLNYRFQDSRIGQVPFFEFTLRNFPPTSPFEYNGFWGDLFAPTDTITIFRTVDTDNIVNFKLSNAWLVSADPPVPVPEPGTLGLVLVGLLGLMAAAWRRARS